MAPPLLISQPKTDEIDIFWLGLIETTEDGFLWEDQSNTDYTNWAFEEPQPIPDGYSQGCALMHGTRSSDQGRNSVAFKMAQKRPQKWPQNGILKKNIQGDPSGGEPGLG